MNKHISFICFSKNRALQLDAYIRSYLDAFKYHLDDIDLTILYTCDPQYLDSYNKIIEEYSNITFVKENVFYADLVSIMNSCSDLVCFGCDDVIYNGNINLNDVFSAMDEPLTFAFSFRLGKNISRSMSAGEYQQPEFLFKNHLLCWDLHTSHQFVDFGYSFELCGTVYYTNIINAILKDFVPNTPNILENSGGGLWSKRTPRRNMLCFQKSKLVVPTLNIVQNNFPNGILNAVSVKDLEQLFQMGFRLDINRYKDLETDCIHISECFLEKNAY